MRVNPLTSLAAAAGLVLTGTAAIGPAAAGQPLTYAYSQPMHAPSLVSAGYTPSLATFTAAVTAPGAPTNVTGIRGDRAVTLTWAAPASNGGSPITGYTVTASPGGGRATTTGATTAAVGGLTNGVSYTFTVTATNIAGTGPASTPSAPLAPAGSKCDLTGDGKADILARDSAGNLYVYPGPGTPTGTLGSRRQIGIGWGGFTTIFCSSDFNGDGKADVVARASNGNLYLYTGTGTGALNPGRQMGTGWNVFNTVFSPGDLTGDGKADIVGRNSSGNLYLYSGTGTGTVNPARQIGTGWNMFNIVFSPGDFTGDGKADILARDSAGNLYLYPGTGTGTLTAGHRIGPGWQSYTTLFSPGDYTGDGNPDVMGISSGYLNLCSGSGTGSCAYSGQRGSGWNIYNLVTSGT